MEDNFIQRIVQRNGLYEDYREQEAVFVWDEIADELKKLARPRQVKQGTLIVDVPSAAAKQELSYMENEYKKKINARLKGPEVKRIKFVLNEKPFQDDERRRSSKRLEDLELSAEEKEFIDDCLRDLDLEKDLETEIRSFLTTLLKVKKIEC